MTLQLSWARFRAVAFLFAVCLCVTASMALAQDLPPGGSPAGGPEPLSRRLLRDALLGGAGAEELGQELLGLLNLPQAQKALGITDEQRKKLEDIAFTARKALVQQRATLLVQRMELQRLMGADNPDRAAIDKKIAEVAQAQTVVMRTMVNGLLDARSALTKEQRDKVKEYLQRQIGQRIQQRVRGGQQGVPPNGAPGPRQAPPFPGPQGPPPPPPAPPRPPGQ